LSPTILFENYDKQVNPIIEGIAISQNYEILDWMIEKGVFKGHSNHLIYMVDSIGSRNILHLCSETNKGDTAIRVINMLMEDGERG